ncbi:MAG: hypothetical protein HOC70_13965 [Gammaproteobacteria bacterium]|jgi:hypothetical protein|nr:hypothetical protein [Gammaproteobacteria bacterium]MBT4494343.1 hypothetical protein [Gammaproteobacteria bacterium]
MKSKIAIAVLVLFAAGAGKAVLFDNGPSYSDQLCELMQRREAGLISNEEYWSVKKHIIGVMLH